MNNFNAIDNLRKSSDFNIPTDTGKIDRELNVDTQNIPPLTEKKETRDTSTAGGAVKSFFKGILGGALGAAYFVAAKPHELRKRDFVHIAGEGGSLKNQLKGIDNAVTGGIKAQSKAERGFARAGGVLGGVLGAAIGTGLAAFTAIYSLGRAASKAIQTHTKASNSKNLEVRQLINDQKDWSPQAVFENKKLVSALESFAGKLKGKDTLLKEVYNFSKEVQSNIKITEDETRYGVFFENEEKINELKEKFNFLEKYDISTPRKFKDFLDFEVKFAVNDLINLFKEKF